MLDRLAPERRADQRDATSKPTRGAPVGLSPAEAGLLAIDQFEELFTHASIPRDRDAFLDVFAPDRSPAPCSCDS